MPTTRPLFRSIVSTQLTGAGRIDGHKTPSWQGTSVTKSNSRVPSLSVATQKQTKNPAMNSGIMISVAYSQILPLVSQEQEEPPEVI